MEIPRLDIEQRIGDTFAYLFSFRQTDGTLRSFTGSTAVLHGQSGADVFHYESGTDPEVEIVDIGSDVDCGILCKIPYATTETWTDDQRFFYEIKEWTGSDRYTLIDGTITAVLGVVDGDD
jgi:hypothetical protein